MPPAPLHGRIMTSSEAPNDADMQHVSPTPWQLQTDGQAGTLERLNELLHELRHKYAVERSELVAAVSEQVSHVRTELESAKAAQQCCARDVEQSYRHLAALDAEHAVAPPDVLAAIREASGKLDGIQESYRRCREQSQMLRTALLGDRARRQERTHQQEQEQLELDMRMRQLEESTASLRSELQALRAVNCEGSSAVMDAVSRVRLDPGGAMQLREMKALHCGVLEELARVKEQLFVLSNKFVTIASYAEREGQQRGKQLRVLEESVRRIEELPRPSSYRGGTYDASWHTRAGELPKYEAATSSPSAASALHGAAMPTNLHHRLVSFYMRYNPAKVPDVDSIIDEYAGAEAELMSSLEVHYGAFGYFSREAD